MTCTFKFPGNDKQFISNALKLSNMLSHILFYLILIRTYEFSFIPFCGREWRLWEAVMSYLHSKSTPVTGTYYVPGIMLVNKGRTTMETSILEFQSSCPVQPRGASLLPSILNRTLPSHLLNCAPSHCCFNFWLYHFTY